MAVEIVPAENDRLGLGGTEIAKLIEYLHGVEARAALGGWDVATARWQVRGGRPPSRGARLRPWQEARYNGRWVEGCAPLGRFAGVMESALRSR